MPVTLDQFVQKLTGSGLMSAAELSAFQGTLADSPQDGETLAKRLVEEKKLTEYQAGTLCNGVTGPLVLGEYVIFDKLGSGGMGDVYKALHRRMNRIVALKTLSRSFDDASNSVERFHREVRAAARLNHPNIVTAHDAGESGDTHYLVMEYVDGVDLGRMVRTKGPLPVAQAVDYTLQAARGLEYAHAQGVIHRDIKPSNLLLDKNGTVKILDMGLARCIAPAGAPGQAEQDITREGVVVGTMNYLSPEQAMNSSNVDQRSDIYNLGCTLYYLITGRYVYGCAQSLADVLLAHRDNSVPSMTEACGEVSAQLDGVFQRMVAKRPAERYQTATELIADLDRCQSEATDAVDAVQNDASTGWTSGYSDSAGKGGSTAATQTFPGKYARSSLRPLVGVAIALGVLLAGLVGLFLAAGVIFSVRTQHGTLVVEVNEPGAKVTVLDEQGKVEIQRTSKGKEEKLSISVEPGRKELRVEKEGFQFFAKGFSILDNGKETIVAHLEPIGKAETPVAGRAENSNVPLTADTAARQRELAEWVIEHRGVVNAFVGAPPKQLRVSQGAVRSKDQLPQQDFQVWRVSFSDVGQEFDDAAFDKFAALAEPLSSIVNLNLNGTSVTSAGLRRLDSIAELENLSLACTPCIADEASVSALTEILRGSSKLTTLLLDKPVGIENGCPDSAITADSLRKLKAALPNENCRIVWGDADHRAFDVVKDLGGKVDVLVEGDVLISDANTEDLSERVFRVRAIDLEGCDAQAAQGCLRKLDELSSLKLANTNADDALLERLSDLPALATLDLQSTSIGDTGLAALSKFKSLKDVYVGETKVTSAGVARLKAGLPQCDIHQ